jgi:imidazolonepropionase
MAFERQKIDLIIENAAQLVTCASQGKPKRLEAMKDVGLIESGSAAVNKGEIVGVGASEEIRRNFQANETIDAGGKVVCPGFVECHTHIVYAGNRLDEFELKIKGADYLEILESGGGILSTVRQTREASLAELVGQSRGRLDKLLALGVTTCEVKTGYGLDAQTELKMLEAIEELDKNHPIDLIPTFLPAHAVPPEFKNKSEHYVAIICNQMIQQAMSWFRNSHFFKRFHLNQSSNPKKVSVCNVEINLEEIMSDTPFFVDVFCEEKAFNLQQAREIFQVAKKLGFKIKAHVDEFTNLGGARMAIELGATSIDHLDVISDEEVMLLADSITIGVVTPTVNFNFGSKEFADARRMIDAGCAIAVSTDYNPGSAPCPSLPNAMAIACRYQKLLPSEALNAATINAAFAVGLGERTGSIEVGKQADILILDTGDYREIAYEFGANLVEKVLKNGKIVCEN